MYLVVLPSTRETHLFPLTGHLCKGGLCISPGIPGLVSSLFGEGVSLKVSSCHASFPRASHEGLCHRIAKGDLLASWVWLKIGVTQVLIFARKTKAACWHMLLSHSQMAHPLLFFFGSRSRMEVPNQNSREVMRRGPSTVLQCSRRRRPTTSGASGRFASEFDRCGTFRFWVAQYFRKANGP